MPRPKDDSKIETIYEATLRIVLKTGFNGLKMADVAKASKLATGTLYIYFKSKEVLINQLFLHLKKAKTQKLMSALNPADSIEEAFKKMWFRYVEVSLEEPERMIFIEQFAHTSFLTKKTKAQSDHLLSSLRDFVELGVKQKKIKNLPIDLLLSQLMGPIYEIVKLQKEGKIQLTNDQKQSLYEMAWQGVKL